MTTHTANEAPFTAQDLEDALYEMEVEDATVTADYSGRGMFGAECFGIVHDAQHAPLIGLAIALAIQEADDVDRGTTLQEAARLCRAARTDNMGRQMITYFPGWTVAA